MISDQPALSSTRMYVHQYTHLVYISLFFVKTDLYKMKDDEFMWIRMKGNGKKDQTITIVFPFSNDEQRLIYYCKLVCQLKNPVI